MTALGAIRDPRRADAVRRRRTWITQPAGYLLILAVLAITLLPMLYLIMSGFRTTGQLGSNPNGLPHPWVWDNYATILTSAAFWQGVENSAIIAVVATALAVVLGSMAAFALSRYMFGVALPEAAFSLPVTIVILRPFMRAIPGEAAADRTQHSVALHAAARGGHVPVAVQHGHREGLRLHRAVHAPRLVHLRVRSALPRRRPGRRDQGLSTQARWPPRAPTRGP
jgi:hypothetical protein